MEDLTPFQILEVVAIRDKAQAEHTLMLAYQSGMYAQADLKKVDLSTQIERIRDPDKQSREAHAREKAIEEARMRAASR